MLNQGKLGIVILHLLLNVSISGLNRMGEKAAELSLFDILRQLRSGIVATVGRCFHGANSSEWISCQGKTLTAERICRESPP